MIQRCVLFCLVLFTGSPLTSAAIIAGNGNAGFGNVIGGGTLELTATTSVLSGTLTTGPGNLNDVLVLYFDSDPGGFTSTATFNDAGNSQRQGISGFDGANRSTVNFAPGFAADFALALDANFSGLYGLSGTGSHTFIASANLTPVGNPAAGSHSFHVNLADFGVAAADSFDFVGTYLNSTNAFRSDEAFGGGISPGNPGQTPITFTSSQTFTAVPEPSAGLMAALCLCGGALTRIRGKRRKRLPIIQNAGQQST